MVPGYVMGVCILLPSKARGCGTSWRKAATAVSQAGAWKRTVSARSLRADAPDVRLAAAVRAKNRDIAMVLSRRVQKY